MKVFELAGITPEEMSRFSALVGTKVSDLKPEDKAFVADIAKRSLPHIGDPRVRTTPTEAFTMLSLSCLDAL
jgi:hypothetical protein